MEERLKFKKRSLQILLTKLYFFYPGLSFKFILLGILISPWKSFAMGSLFEGFFLLRNTNLQIQTQSLKNFSTYSQFYLKGSFQPSNEIKTQLHFLSSQNYGEKFSLNHLFQFYPSAHWLLSENLELKLGRNLYEKKRDSLSLNSFENSWYSLDGMILEYNTQTLNFDFWSAYLPERWIAMERKKELNYGFGFFLDINLTSFYIIDSFRFQASYLGDSFTDQKANKMSRYGISVVGFLKTLNLGYDFSAVGQSSGLQFKLEENMYHGMIYYKKQNFFNSEFFIGYHTDSPNYNPWLYNRHEHSGLSDFLQWRNLSYYFIGTNFFPFKKLKCQITFLGFDSTSQGEIDLGAFGSFIHAKKNINVEKESLGKEINIKILSKVTEVLELQLLTAFFLAQSSSLKKDKQNLYNNLQLTALYKF
ncbi:MAG: hypothetical protein GDA46_01275 [Bdellovibrionales bacterium]|nr:hypothetical protein [Bdellovibrionales bacterium]